MTCALSLRAAVLGLLCSLLPWACSSSPAQSTADASDATSCNCGLVGTAPSGSCAFTLPCPAVGGLHVFVGGSQIPQDTSHADGWDYADTARVTVQIYGPSCAAITSAPATAVGFTYACPA